MDDVDRRNRQLSPDAALPVDQFKARICGLAQWFAEDDVQDEVLKGFLRAALAAIEARTGKVLIERDFSWSLNAWRDPSGRGAAGGPGGSSVGTVTLVRCGGGRDWGRCYRVSAGTRYAAAPDCVPPGLVCHRVQTGGSVKMCASLPGWLRIGQRVAR